MGSQLFGALFVCLLVVVYSCVSPLRAHRSANTSINVGRISEREAAGREEEDSEVFWRRWRWRPRPAGWFPAPPPSL